MWLGIPRQRRCGLHTCGDRHPAERDAPAQPLVAVGKPAVAGPAVPGRGCADQPSCSKREQREYVYCFGYSVSTHRWWRQRRRVRRDKVAEADCGGAKDGTGVPVLRDALGAEREQYS